MKPKHLLTAILAFCGIMVLTSSKSVPRVDNDSKIWIGMTGLDRGSVDVRILHNGETYLFSSLSAIPVIPGFLGEFRCTGASFDIEITLNNTPSLTQITTSHTLRLEEISTLKYRVIWISDDEDDRRMGGEIGLHFE